MGDRCFLVTPKIFVAKKNGVVIYLVISVLCVVFDKSI